MIGVQIQKRARWTWVAFGFSSVVASIVAAIAFGPKWVFAASFLGLVVGFSGVLFSLNDPDHYPAVGYSGTVIGLHVVLMIVAWVLQGLFLSPLSDSALKMPHFEHRFIETN